MRTTGSKQLVEGIDDNGDQALYVIIGNDDGTYELHRAQLVHHSHHARKWQAVRAATGENV